MRKEVEVCECKGGGEGVERGECDIESWKLFKYSRPRNRKKADINFNNCKI